MFYRITSCHSFRECNCPHQKVMERVYLIPQLIDPEELNEYQRQCLTCLQCEHGRREIQRLPVSFLVDCKQDDLTRMGGKAFNLSTKGIAIYTNYPLRVGEQFAIEFVLSAVNSTIKAVGEVVWSKFHGDTACEREALFTVGIKFLHLSEPQRTFIGEYVQNSLTLEVA
jgi:hypothetical protein